MAGAVIEVKYFNTFVLKKTVQAGSLPIWNGSFGIPKSIGGYNVVTNTSEEENWAIEESRIRGGYNNTSVDFGVKAYLVEDEPNATRRGNSLIYSGIFNSRTGINNSNVFSVGQDITKSADPANGSIQKLYAEDTNLIIFQERKVSRALIDKDAIYSAEGGGSVTSSRLVIGVIQPYAGRWGISTNPESFAVYGYRKYFSDKNNNVILRLSKDGITEISDYGLKDFFRDELNNISTSSTDGFVRGGYDIHNSQYVVSTSSTPAGVKPIVGGGISELGGGPKTIVMSSPQGTILAGSYVTSTAWAAGNNSFFVADVANDKSSITLDEIPPFLAAKEKLEFTPPISNIQTYKTLSFDETINGWTSLYSYQPDQILSVRNKFYTIAPSINAKGLPGGGYGIWEHYSSKVNRGNFYGFDNPSSVTLVFNPDPTRSKTFKTVSYEGSNGWNSSAIGFDGSNSWSLAALASGDTGKNYNAVSAVWENGVDIVNNVRSYIGGEYVISDSEGVATTDSILTTVKLVGTTGSIPVGASVSGVGVVPGTIAVGFDPITTILTVSQALNIVEGTILSFYKVVSSSDYYTAFGTLEPGLPRYHAGFDRKENTYVANLVNNSSPASGEILFGGVMSGIKGFYTTATFRTDNTTDFGGEKQLFLVSSNFTTNNGY